jgi:hypothetical protein
VAVVMFFVVLLAISCMIIATQARGADKADLQKDVQIYRLAKQNLELQMQVLQRDYPIIEEKLKAAEAELKQATEKELKDAAEKAKKKKEDK